VGGVATGTVTSGTIDLSDDGDIDIQLTDIPNVDLQTMIASTDAFLQFGLGGGNTYTVGGDIKVSLSGDGISGSLSVAPSNDTFDVVGGGLNAIYVLYGDHVMTDNVPGYTGADDVSNVSGMFGDGNVIYGDAAFGEATGGADTFTVDLENSAQMFFAGDFSSAGTGSVTGGNDAFTLTGMAERISIWGDQGSIGNSVTDATLHGGDDTIDGIFSVAIGDVAIHSNGTTYGGIDTITETGTNGARISGDVDAFGSFAGFDQLLVAGGDILTGGNGSNLIAGDIYTVSANATAIEITFGHDTIDAKKGNDEIWGDFQSDLSGLVSGNAGGSDTIKGGQGADTIYGQGGIDDIDGGGGADVIDGGTHDDIINGGNGNDTIDGSRGNDTLSGARANDVLNGGLGDDTLSGGSGFDGLIGGDGHDTIDGEGGADIIEGRSGDDTLTGGAGADDFIFEEGFGNDIITDFNATGNGEDIDLSQISAIVDWSDLESNHMTLLGLDVLIDDLAGNTITLLNVDIADLGQLDFIF